MIAEGRIIIEMGRDGDVRLNSNRGAGVARMLRGRSRDDVLELLPRLFSLCGHAHVAAARRAMAGQQEIGMARLDSLMVLAENAREHLLRIMTGWRAKSEQPVLAAAPVMSLVGGMKAALGNPEAEQSQTDKLAALLENDVLGMQANRFLALEGVEAFHEWLAGSPKQIKDYLAGIVARGWEGMGAVHPRYLPELPTGLLSERFRAPVFSQRPDWQGKPHETGPLERQSRHPLVAALVRESGAGLLARLVARLVELARIPEQMQAGDSLVQGSDGLGVVETARGRLIHAATQKDQVISGYHILAPTEWNFHPQGVAVQALRTLPPWADLPLRAGVLVEAIDPCVAFEVRAV